MNTPKLRFKDENGKEFPEWEASALGELAKISKGKGISKADIIEGGAILCIRYGELYTHYCEIIKTVVSRTNVSKQHLVFSRQNDVIIPASGETAEDISTASCILHDGIALGGDINIIRTELNGIFLAYYLNYFKKIEIARLAQGNSVVHLYPNQLKQLSIIFPSLPEQQKIADFLSSVDERIDQATKKVDLLERYKKGAMQQIFSQKLRFKDKNGQELPEWEEKKLGDIAEICTGKKDLQDSVDGGAYRFYVRAAKIERINSYTFDGEAILIPGDGVNVGKIYHYATGKFDYHQRVYKISDFNQSVGRYIFFYMAHQFQAHAMSYNSKASVDSLRLPIVQKFQIALPSLPEQQKIADFLSAIDDKIESARNQLEALKTFKKGLLQQMFV